MTTPRGDLSFSVCDTEHQRLDMYHQKVGVGVTASTFNFLEHQKSRGDIMKQIRFIASKKHQSIAFCIFREPRFTKSHFDAQIGHHFPICSALFSIFPSVASSKEQQINCCDIVFYVNM